MKQKLFTVALLGAIALPNFSYAEDTMELVIVTPTRMEQSLDKTLADTTVLDEQAIRQSGAADVPTLLRTLAGVEVKQSGGLGKQSSTFMRGTNSSHVLVLLDGVRINSATTGTTALEHIMLDSIERIEIVRGNVSSLYGSEAIGGVIQLFTRRGRGETTLNASAGIGSHGTQRVSAGYSGSTDSTSFSINAGKVKTVGVSAIDTEIAPTANPDKDGYDNNTLNAQIRHAISDDHQLSASLFSTRGDSAYDMSGSWGNLPTDEHRAVANLDKVAFVSDNRLTDNWKSHVSLSRGKDGIKSYLNGVEGSHFNTVNRQLTWQNELQIADTQRVNLALERLEQMVDADTAYTQTKRTVNSMLGGYVAEYGAHQAQLNLRQDRYNDFGVANTWLIGYGFEVTDAWRVTASMATAFKAPTLNDMFYPFVDYGFGYSYAGNLDLKPERSRDNEIGLHYANGGQRLDVVYFDNRIRDLIVLNNLPAATMINLDEARSDGVELSYAGKFGDTGMSAAVTSQNPRDTATGEVLLRRAKIFGNLGVTQQLGALKVGGEWQYSGKREDNDINTFARTTLAAYSVVNLTAIYALGEQLDLTMRVDNLFDRDYMLAHGYNTLGRTIFVGLNYQP